MVTNALVDNLVISGNEEKVAARINELLHMRIKLDKLTKKNDEIGTMELKHREEIIIIREQMNQIMVMVQRNPILANIKPEILIGKNKT